MKLAYNGHDIDSVAINSDNGHWGVDVTIEWFEGLEYIVEKKRKFGPYEMFSSQTDAEAWGVLAAVRWIDAGKPDTEALSAR
jgi:hypothetical protein